MTENKRYSFNWERRHPNFWDNHCDLADCYLTCEDVVELLNELHEENTRLTEELEYYKSKCGSLEEGYLKLQRENYKLKKRLDEIAYYFRDGVTLRDLDFKDFEEIKRLVSDDTE